MMKMFGESYNWWNPWHWKKIRAYDRKCAEIRKEIEALKQKYGKEYLWEFEEEEFEKNNPN